MNDFTAKIILLYSQGLEGKVKAGKVNCQEEQYLCQQARISAYPSVRFYRGTTSPKKMQVSLYCCLKHFLIVQSTFNYHYPIKIL